MGPGAGLESLRPAGHSMSYTGCRERGNLPHSRMTIVTTQLLGAVGIYKEALFPILLLESVVNFSGRDVFSNEEFDHNALFHAPRYLLFAHHSATPRQD